MTTYSIYFTNNNSALGQSQDYAFFCDVPSVTSSSGSPAVYSNVFLSNKLASGANWNIDMTKNYYAWCGTSPQQLAPDVKVSVGMGKLATLGTTAAGGSTFEMYNNGGNPAFTADTIYTADPGCYEIDTGTDFTPNLNFLIGLGGTDNFGRMKPLATIAAPGNAIVQIAPVTRFYIAAYSSTAGTVINTRMVSRSAAKIDFTANPGMFASIVDQDKTGAFSVRYVASAQSAMEIANRQKPALQLRQMKHQFQLFQKLFESVFIDRNIRFKCTLSWLNGPSKSDQTSILHSLIDKMQALGYSYESGGVENGLQAIFTYPPPHSLDQTIYDWKLSCFELEDKYKRYTTDPRTSPAPPSVQIDGDEGVDSVDGAETETHTIQAQKERALKLLKDEGLEHYGRALNGA